MISIAHYVLCVLFTYKREVRLSNVFMNEDVLVISILILCASRKFSFWTDLTKCLKMYAQKILRWGSNFTKWQRSLNFKVFLFYKFVLPLMVSKWKSSWHLGEGSSSFRCIIFSTHVGFPSTPLNCMVFRIIISDIFIHCFTPVKNNYLR